MQQTAGDRSGYDQPSGMARSRRYTEVAVWLHWITAALVLAMLPLAWVMTSLPENDPRAEIYFSLHKSIGLTIFVLAAPRLIWRAMHPAPPVTDRLAPWAALLARTNHILLYVILIAMPLSGYLLTVAGGYPLTWFGLFTVPGPPKNETVATIADTIHVFGRLAVYFFVSLHVLAVAYHIVVRRDGTLERMLPPQTNRP